MSESPPLPDTPVTPPASAAAEVLPARSDGATKPVQATGDGSGTNWGSLRPLLLRLHFYAGVVIGPFLLVAAVTGLAYTATPQIESILYEHELKVTPRGSAEPLAEQVAAAERAVPDGTLLSVTKGAGPSDSTRVAFSKDGLAEGYTLTAF
ncbi:PepSY domain-containing protein, partial [Streptomyces sp. SID5926]|nr:PepSY domain-containing protein [Streptomyces sp. SID5926]